MRPGRNGGTRCPGAGGRRPAGLAGLPRGRSRRRGGGSGRGDAGAPWSAGSPCGGERLLPIFGLRPSSLRRRLGGASCSNGFDRGMRWSASGCYVSWPAAARHLGTIRVTPTDGDALATVPLAVSGARPPRSAGATVRALHRCREDPSGGAAGEARSRAAGRRPTRAKGRLRGAAGAIAAHRRPAGGRRPGRMSSEPGQAYRPLDMFGASACADESLRPAPRPAGGAGPRGGSVG